MKKQVEKPPVNANENDVPEQRKSYGDFPKWVPPLPDEDYRVYIPGDER